MTMRFYREGEKWFADFKEWTGDKWELEMVCGADTMLELIAQGENECHLALEVEPFEGANALTKIKDTPDIGGALYLLKEYKGVEYNMEVWLCHVTGHVFGHLPEIIYIA